MLHLSPVLNACTPFDPYHDPYRGVSLAAFLFEDGRTVCVADRQKSVHCMDSITGRCRKVDVELNDTPEDETCRPVSMIQNGDDECLALCQDDYNTGLWRYSISAERVTSGRFVRIVPLPPESYHDRLYHTMYTASLVRLLVGNGKWENVVTVNSDNIINHFYRPDNMEEKTQFDFSGASSFRTALKHAPGEVNVLGCTGWGIGNVEVYVAGPDRKAYKVVADNDRVFPRIVQAQAVQHVKYVDRIGNVVFWRCLAGRTFPKSLGPMGLVALDLDELRWKKMRYPLLDRSSAVCVRGNTLVVVNGYQVFHFKIGTVPRLSFLAFNTSHSAAISRIWRPLCPRAEFQAAFESWWAFFRRRVPIPFFDASLDLESDVPSEETRPDANRS